MQFWYGRRAANLGYAFVNFTSTVAASRFYKKFHEKMWEEVSSNNKTREVTCAKLQVKFRILTLQSFWLSIFFV